MSTVPIRWRPLGGRDLVAGEVLFAKAVASWQEAWFCEPALKVQGEIFGEIRPAASIYVIGGLARPEMKIEIEATARIPRP